MLLWSWFALCWRWFRVALALLGAVLAHALVLLWCGFVLLWRRSGAALGCFGVGVLSPIEGIVQIAATEVTRLEGGGAGQPF